MSNKSSVLPSVPSKISPLAFISPTANVYASSPEYEMKVSADAHIGDGCTVVDSEVSGTSRVLNNSTVIESRILGNALVTSSEVTDKSLVGFQAVVEKSHICKESVVEDSAYVSGVYMEDSSVTDRARVTNVAMEKCSIMDDAVVDFSGKKCFIMDDAAGDFTGISLSHRLRNLRITGNAVILSPKDLLVLGPAPSSGRFTTAYRDSVLGIRVICGCFDGSLERFRQNIEETHGMKDVDKDGKPHPKRIHLQAYRMYADFIEAYFAL